MTPTIVGEHAKRAELATEIASIGVVKTVPGVSMKSRTRPVMRYTGLVERSGQELPALWTGRSRTLRESDRRSRVSAGTKPSVGFGSLCRG